MAVLTEDVINQVVAALREVIPSGVATTVVLIDTTDQEAGGIAVFGNNLAKELSHLLDENAGIPVGQARDFGGILREAISAEKSFDDYKSAGQAKGWTNTTAGNISDGGVGGSGEKAN